jgi:hypothetical protein
LVTLSFNEVSKRERRVQTTLEHRSGEPTIRFRCRLDRNIGTPASDFDRDVESAIGLLAAVPNRVEAVGIYPIHDESVRRQQT